MLQEVSWIDEQGELQKQEVTGDPWEFIETLNNSVDIIIYRNGKEVDWIEHGRSLRNI